MTLSEIETILASLVARHPNLDRETLSTLLLAAGWEDRLIKDALTLFKQTYEKKEEQKPASVASVVKVAKKETVNVPRDAQSQKEGGDVTFYHPDGGEERKVKIIEQGKYVRPVESQGFFASFFGALFGGFSSAPIVVTPSAYTPQEEVVITQASEQRKAPEIVSAPAPVVVVQEAVAVAPVPITVVVPEQVAVPPVPPTPAVAPIIEQPISVPAPVVVATPLPVETPSPVFVPPVVVEVPAPSPVVQVVQEKIKEPESLIVHSEVPPVVVEKKESEIPGNLPLLPFESSPHVWSFSRYKDVFHGDTAPVPEKKQEPLVVKNPETTVTLSQKVQTPVIHKEGGDEEIVIEKTPLTKGDESLVFLAGVMLLVIILILGYMYSNGRL